MVRNVTRPVKVRRMSTRKLLLLICCLLTLLPSVAHAVEAGVVTSEFIFETAPFPSCHASTIVETPDGLVAAWFGGKHEKHPSVGIWASRHVGGRWTDPIEVANGNQKDASRQPCWNPVLFQPKSGPLLLFYKVGPSPDEWWGELKQSSDNGKTWSEATRLPEGIVGPIKNKPVQLPNGDILCGSSSEDSPPPNDWRVHFELSTDNGKTWSKIKPAISEAGKTDPSKEVNAIQPSLLTYADGRLQAVGRSRSGRIFETWSTDNGRSWTALTLTNLPNPNSGTDAVSLSDGRQLIVYNHTPKGRSPLNAAISKEGKEWLAALTLERDPGEYSYPAVIQTRDGLVHFTYTWKRQRIKHVVVDPSKLHLRPIPNGVWPSE